MTDSKRVHRVRCAVLSTVGLLAACAQAPTVSPEDVAAEEERILAPFRQQQTVVADELELVMTANFFPRITPQLNLAAHDQERRERPDGGADYVYTARPGTADPMRFHVENTVFGVLGRARVTVLGGRNDMKFSAVATGAVSVERGQALEHGREVRIENGAFRKADG